MIEVRITTTADPAADRCFFCGDRWSEPDPVPALVYQDGAFTGAQMCGTCRFLPDDQIRSVLREHAEHLTDLVVSLAVAAEEEIRRPSNDVLVLEHWYRQAEEGE